MRMKRTTEAAQQKDEKTDHNKVCAHIQNKPILSSLHDNNSICTPDVS